MPNNVNRIEKDRYIFPTVFPYLHKGISINVLIAID